MAMTEHELNSEIAQALGWLFVPEHDRMSPQGHETAAVPEFWRNTEGEEDDLPNYYKDLNLIKEANKDIPQRHRNSWKLHCRLISLRDSDEGSDLEDRLLGMTAPQFCEAFVKSMGLWK